MSTSFDNMNLNKALLNAMLDLGFTAPTPIQEKAFPAIMSGRDVIGIAQTGTGKTFAYLLPILRQLTFSNQKDPRVLIVVPTRELVVQVVGEIRKLTTYMNVRVEGVYGGTNINTQKVTVVSGLDILVGTPGRIMDMGLSRIVLLRNIKQLVIDEVDEMLSLGFRSQLTMLFDMMSPRRQNILFSATMTEEVDALMEVFFNGPLNIEVTRAGTPLEKIHQSCYRVTNFNTKLNLLERLLATDESMKKILIFCATKKIADRTFLFLDKAFPDAFDVIHGNKSQNFRLNAVASFEAGRIRGLIATDLLARGLDVTDVSHVINLNIPDTPEAYIHRIGRTGRADTEGAAVALISDLELDYLAAIEELMEKKIPLLETPEDVEVSNTLTDEEIPTVSMKNYLVTPTLKASQGAFHEKIAKNKKVNIGNATKRKRDAKYTKPIKKKAKVRGGK